MKFQGDTKVGLPTASVIAKMINTPQDNNQGNNKVDVGGLESIITQLTKKQSLNEDLLGLFPDIQFCAETVSNTIISPNDMVTKSFNLNFDTLKLGTDLKGSLSEVIKANINNYYELDNNLSDIIYNSLFIKGAHVECFIPESAIDDIINSEEYKKQQNESGEITVESFVKFSSKSNKGIFKDNNISIKEYGKIISGTLSTETGVKFEKFEDEKTSVKVKDELGIEFLDDYSCLFSSFVSKELTKKSISNLYKKNNDKKISTESGLTTLKTEISKIFKDPRKLEEEKLLNIECFNDTTRKSIGRPLNIKLDMNIVKPIWSNTPDNHIGYLVLLDDNSNIINSKNYLDSNNGFESGIISYSTTNTKSITDNILSRAISGLKNMTEKDKDLENMEELYGSILHNTIIKKLNDGKMKDIANLSKDQNFLNIMFKRALKGKKTKVLFLPVDVVSYFAYEFRDNGIGLSRLDKISVLMSMRAIMLFAKLMSNIKNSIPITEVEATIDSKEPDIKGAISKIVSSTMKNHQVSLPIGTADVNSLVQWVHNLGYVYNISSDRLPDTKVKLNDSSRNIRVPEDTISEILEELCYMEFFMNAEMVKSGKDANFATTIITQNKLFENRIIKQQIKTEKLLTRHIRTILNNDALIRREIKSIIDNNFKEIKKLNKDFFQETKGYTEEDIKEVLIDIIIEDISVTLPKPTSLNEGNNLKTTLQDYSDAIDSYVEKVFDDEAFSAAFAGDEASENIGSYRAIIKKMLIQEWITENNYIPSVSKFLTLDDNNQSINNLFTQYSDMKETFNILVKDFVKKNKKQVEKINNDINKIKSETDENTDSEFDNPTDIKSNEEDENLLDNKEEDKDLNLEEKEDDKVDKEKDIEKDEDGLPSGDIL